MSEYIYAGIHAKLDTLPKMCRKPVISGLSLKGPIVSLLNCLTNGLGHIADHLG